MVTALVTVLVIAILAGLFYWVIDQIPVPEPINRWAKLAIVIIAVVCLVMVLLGLGGYGPGLALR
jgi:quinol-cytochrome oxidoreductase complex cytochrome b subunit